MVEKETLNKKILEKQEEGLKKEALEKEKQEHERLEQWKKQNRIIINNMLFIIPSWTHLLGYPTLGIYVNQNVEKIHTDIVIFFAGAECSFETEKGVLHFVFGLGYYFTKFEVKSGAGLTRGKYIVDNRMLTGLVLSDFVYDQLASSKRITLENEADVIIAEDIIKVPIDVSFKTENQITFIKGALMRNVFIPNKDIFLEMMEKISHVNMYNLENTGHMLLSAQWNHYNKILVSEKMKSSFYKDYLNTTAGLSEICYGADDFLNKTLSPVEHQKVSNIMKILKKEYSIIKYDPNYFYSILQNATNALKNDFPEGLSQRILSTEPTGVKASVLFSAENRKGTIINWPNEFERKEKVEVSPSLQKPVLLTGVENVERPYDINLSKIQDYCEPQRDSEEFKLRVEKSEKVEKKSLPPPPEGDIEEILLYIKKVIEENYEMLAIGKAFAMARDNLRKIILQADYMWEMSKYSNIYLKKPPSLSLPPKDKNELIERINTWILVVQKEKQKEQERREKERLEKERKEKEERERQEKEQRERERKERETKELEKLERERKLLEEKKNEMAKMEKIKQEKERIRLEREKLEQERLQKEKMEKERLEKEKIQQQLDKERLERENLDKERKELKIMKQERKKREKKEKQQKKKEQKLEKEKKKLEKLRLKEESLSKR